MTDNQNTLARSLHDLGLAAWFGGSLMGAVGLNGASGEVSDPRDRTRVANAGWGRWTPVNAVAIAAHVVGSTQLARANKGRLLVQRGVGAMSGAKTALLAASLAATGYSRMLGQKIMDAEARQLQTPFGVDGMPSQDATTPAAGTDDEAANAQRQLRALQWAIPLLTGAMLVLNAKAGEQQRPAQVARGILDRLNPAA
jgi:hypothetical protein